ncbi:hypothetical protein [Scytonema sp. PRP1]|uniref:hypothetical protein n=1 Tax=Scytonema sp. PRP1 TaxID=3120513 RepID=UPI002FCF6C67
MDNLRVIHNVNAGHLGCWSFFKAAASLIYPLEVETAAKALAQVGIPEKLSTCSPPFWWTATTGGDRPCSRARSRCYPC